MPSRLVQLVELRKPTGPAMNADLTFSEQVTAVLPSLRAFAISLTGNTDYADDLVQETFARAWAHADRFERGTNLNAWMLTILRNQFHSDQRKRRREVEDADGVFAAKLSTYPEQQTHLEYEDFRAALARVPAKQRQALLLVGAQELSYEEAAAICNVPAGTIKSRVNRARCKLAELLHLRGDAEFGPDSVTKAVIAAESRLASPEYTWS